MQKRIQQLPYLFCYLIAIVFGLKQLREPDVWWQLLTGRWMLENGAITRTDSFSYTMEGTEWINVKWLYELIIASLEKGFGPHVVILLQVAINVAIAYLLIRLIQLFFKRFDIKHSDFFTVLSIFLFFSIAENRMTGRPEMVSHLMTTLYLYILFKNPSFNWKKIFWLIPLQCLWANMHEGYPIGIIIIGTFALGSFLSYLLSKNKDYLQQTIRLGGVGLAAIVAILLNPNGLQLWKQPFEIFRQLSANKYTIELFSFTEAQYWTLQAKANFIVIIVAVIFWVVYIISKRKGKPSLFRPTTVAYLILLALFGYLSLSANRNIPFTEIIFIPSIAIAIPYLASRFNLNQQGWYHKLSKRWAVITIIIGALLYASVVSNQFYEYNNSPNKYGAHVSMLNNPIGAANFIKKHNIKGPAFSDYFISSYLLWDNYPNFKSYIDLRDLDIFPSTFFDDYFELNYNPSKFYALDSIYNFNYVVLSTSQLPLLQQKLYWGHGFNVVYVDPVSIILLRENEENDAFNHNLGVQQLFTWPEQYDDPAWATLISKFLNPTLDYDEDESRVNAPRYGAVFYNSVNNFKVAKRLLLPALYTTDLREDAVAFSTMGNTYVEFGNVAANEGERRNRLDSARMFLETAISLDDKTASAYSGLANLSLMNGLPQAAVDYLDTYIKLKPLDDFGYYLRGISYHFLLDLPNGLDNADKMISDMKKSLAINEHSTKTHLYIAEGYYKKGDKTNTRTHLKEVIAADNYWVAEEKALIEKLKDWTGMK
ncbi:MAG: hypothetical protein R2800_12475 [Flavipsychrobacter sp.]